MNDYDALLEKYQRERARSVRRRKALRAANRYIDRMKIEHKAKLQAERAKCARLRLRLAKLEDKEP